MINVDIFVMIDPDTEVSCDVSAVDKQVEVAIGPIRGKDSVVRLIAGDPETCTKIAAQFMEAHDRFVREVIEGEPAAQDNGAERSA